MTVTGSSGFFPTMAALAVSLPGTSGEINLDCPVPDAVEDQVTFEVTVGDEDFWDTWRHPEWQWAAAALGPDEAVVGGYHRNPSRVSPSSPSPSFVVISESGVERLGTPDGEFSFRYQRLIPHSGGFSAIWAELSEKTEPRHGVDELWHAHWNRETGWSSPERVAELRDGFGRFRWNYQVGAAHWSADAGLVVVSRDENTPDRALHVAHADPDPGSEWTHSVLKLPDEHAYMGTIAAVTARSDTLLIATDLRPPLLGQDAEPEPMGVLAVPVFPRDGELEPHWDAVVRFDLGDTSARELRWLELDQASPTLMIEGAAGAGREAAFETDRVATETIDWTSSDRNGRTPGWTDLEAPLLRILPGPIRAEGRVLLIWRGWDSLYTWGLWHPACGVLLSTAPVAEDATRAGRERRSFVGSEEALLEVRRLDRPGEASGQQPPELSPEQITIRVWLPQGI